MKNLVTSFWVVCIFVLLSIASCKKDPCENAVCLNGGTCNSEGKCECPSGYIGEHCETLVDPCSTVNCQNGGTCVNGVCNCPPNYSGANCETYNNPCGTITCYNGGTCVNGVCNCPPGFSGTYCQTPQNTYAKSVTIFSIPASDWDSFSSPDLKVYFGRSSNTTSWDYASPEFSDHSNTPVTIDFYSPILLTNENWDIQIVDVDTPDPDDVIYSSFGFNPFPIPSDLKIKFSSDGQVKFQINLQ